MVLEDPGVIHLVDEVGGKDEHALRSGVLENVEILAEGIGGSLIPAGPVLTRVGLEDGHPSVPAVQIPGLPRPIVAASRAAERIRPTATL
jgi:hypothetical protein